MWWYLSLLAFPHPERLNRDHDFRPYSKSFQDPPTTVLAILWYALGLSVESTVIGLEIVFEHRL